MVHERVMNAIYDGLRTNIIAKDKYRLRMSVKDSKFYAFRIEDEKLLTYKVVMKKNTDRKDCLTFKKSYLDDVDYLIVIDRYFKPETDNLKFTVCKVIHRDNLFLNFNIGMFDMVNGDYILTSDFIEHAESTSLML